MQSQHAAQRRMLIDKGTCSVGQTGSESAWHALHGLEQPDLCGVIAVRAECQYRQLIARQRICWAPSMRLPSIHLSVEGSYIHCAAGLWQLVNFLQAFCSLHHR